MDEADFWASDERAEIVKILNNGNARGFPVLRSEVTASKEFAPRAFDIFGPKLVATRHPFEDAALESRCLTEVLGQRSLRTGIPVSLPAAFHTEAESLRNELLAYRVRRFGASVDIDLLRDESLPPRRAQILAPLLSVAVDARARDRLSAFVAGRSTPEPGAGFERRVLEVVRDTFGSGGALGLGDIARELVQRHGRTFGEVDSRSVGTALRRVGLQRQKSNGVYVVSPLAYGDVHRVLREHGLGDPRDSRDISGGVEAS